MRIFSLDLGVSIPLKEPGLLKSKMSLEHFVVPESKGLCGENIGTHLKEFPMAKTGIIEQKKVIVVLGYNL